MKLKKWYYFYSYWMLFFFISYKYELHIISPFITYVFINLLLPFLISKIKPIKNYPLFILRFLIYIILDVLPLFYTKIDFSLNTILFNLLFFILHLLFIQPKSLNDFKSTYYHNNYYAEDITFVEYLLFTFIPFYTLNTIK
jgi:hypothetical protein